MDAAVAAVLAEYEKRGAEEHKLQSQGSMDRWLARRDEFLLAVGPATGQLLNILAKAAKSRTILELGTSYGYSTVWLAEAARATGGKLITIEKAANKQNYARTMLGKAGLTAHVDFRLGDARDTIASLKGPFDFVLVDLWKELYIDCFELFYPKLSPAPSSRRTTCSGRTITARTLSSIASTCDRNRRLTRCCCRLEAESS
jgi:predicted O-methyltransferase YrrM